MGILSNLFGLLKKTKKKNSTNVMTQVKAKASIAGMTREAKVKKLRALKSKGYKPRVNRDGGLEYAEFDLDFEVVLFYLLYAMDDILYAEENDMYMEEEINYPAFEEPLHEIIEEVMPSENVIEEAAMPPVEKTIPSAEETMPSAAKTMPAFESPAFDSYDSGDSGGDDGGCDCD